jgi:hypothetical protein
MPSAWLAALREHLEARPAATLAPADIGHVARARLAEQVVRLTR